METVTLSKRTLALLVGALVVALVATAFLLGRESAQSRQAAEATASPLALPPRTSLPTNNDLGPHPSPVAVVALPPTQASPPQRASAASPSSPLSPPRAASTPVLRPSVADCPPQQGEVAQVPPPAPAPKKPSAPARKVATIGGNPALRASVAAYFSAIDNIGPGRLGDDPNSFAQELLQATMNGDTSGFDRLVAQAQESEDKARALHPPAPCRHYHQGSLALLHESTQLLSTLKGSIAQGQTEALASLSGKASGLQSRAQSLEREEARIKSQFGIGASGSANDEGQDADSEP